jgi:hypothetical protein
VPTCAGSASPRGSPRHSPRRPRVPGCLYGMTLTPGPPRHARRSCRTSRSGGTRLRAAHSPAFSGSTALRMIRMPGASAVAVASRYPRDADGSKRHATSRSACLPSASLGYRGTRGCRGSGRPPPTEYPTPFRARGICESRGATCVVPLPRLVSVRTRSRTLTHRALTRRTTGLVIYTRAAPSYEPTPTGHPVPIRARGTRGFAIRKDSALGSVRRG